MTTDIANIANPIYDGVFKYLLDDNRIARMFLSALIGSEISELTFRPTEYRAEGREYGVTLFRLDFAATIRTEDGGAKQVLIEIQKAKLAEDIMRFRRYLGGQYSSAENYILREDAGTGPRKVPLEIFTIYFLGHQLEHTKEPVVWVRRGYYGADGNRAKPIEGLREEFIEALTHDSIVVQIPYLKKRRRTELERLLAIFDQSQKVTGNGHMLGLNVADYPAKYHDVIRRLAKAAADKTVRHEMDIEDNFLNDLREMERTTALQFETQLRAANQKAEEASKRAEEANQRAEEERRQKEALQERLRDLEKQIARLPPQED